MTHQQKMTVAQNIIDRNNGAKLLTKKEYINLIIVLAVIQIVISVANYLY